MPTQNFLRRAARLAAALSIAAPVAAALAAPIPLDAFAALPLFRQIELSPDGTHIAYRRPTPDGNLAVVVHPVDDASELVVLPWTEGSRVRWFTWLNAERLAVSYGFSRSVERFGYYRVRDGDDLEQTRLLAFRRDGGDLRKPVELALPEANCSSAGSKMRERCPTPLFQDDVVDWLPDDPRHILLALDADLRGVKVRRVDVRNGRFRVVRSEESGIYRWVTDREHEVRFGYGEDAEGQPRGIVLRSDGSWEDVSDLGWMQQEIVPVAFDEDPRYAIAVGPANGETDAVVRVDFEHDEVLEVMHEHPALDLYPRFDADGRLIGYVIPADGNRLVLTDPAWERLYRSMVEALPGRRIGLLSWTPDRQVILVMASTPRDAGSLYVWDRGAKTLSLLGSSYPGLDPAQLSPMEEVRYETRDGLEITAYLTTPQGEAPEDLPVVIMPHGGPAGRDTLTFDFLVQAIASRGYAVLQPNFRGSIYQGRTFREAGEGEWGRKMQQDLLDGLAWLVDEGIADPARACIVGWSYGGYAALMGAVQSPDVFRCAVSINGVADLARLRTRYDSRSWRREIDRLVGTRDIRLADYSPVERAKDVKIPVLIVHAQDDGRVPFDDHGRQMARALERAGRDVTLVTVEAGDHSLYNAVSRLTMLKAVDAFLARHLGS